MRAAGRYSVQLMIHRAIQVLRWLTAQSVLRRALVLVCALAFITVTVAHGAQHLNGAAHGTTISDALSSGDGPDPEPATPAIDHCCVCTAAMLSGSPATVRDLPRQADRVIAAPHDSRPFIPTSETRPPIALI